MIIQSNEHAKLFKPCWIFTYTGGIRVQYPFLYSSQARSIVKVNVITVDEGPDHLGVVLVRGCAKSNRFHAYVCSKAGNIVRI